jgi:hypothetical protein
MKRFLYVVITLLMFSVPSFASDTVYDDTLVNGSVANTGNYTLDCSAKGIDYLSFQAVYSTETLTAITFVDGTRSTGTISILSNTGLTGAVITVNGKSFTQGINWAVGSLSSNTATNIYNAIIAVGSGQGSNIAFSLAASATVIYATATVSGVNYTLASSTPTAISVVGMTGAVATDLNYQLDRINKTNSYATGLSLLATATAGTLPTGLTANTTYFVIAGDGTYLKLATSKANSLTGTTVDFSQGSVDKGTFVLTPVKNTDNFAFKWQSSNDGMCFCDLSVSSITVTPTTGSTGYCWDFSKFNYEYLRCALSAGTFGSINLKLKGFGRKVAP